MKRSQVMGLVCAAALLAGCVEKADHVRPVDRQAVARWVTKAATKPEHALHAKLGSQVELVGYDVAPTPLEAGKPFTITWHWKVLASLDGDWRQFTHVADARGNSRLNEDVSGLVRTAYPPNQWKAGEYIRDAQRIELPADWNSKTATFYLGIWKDDQRLPVTEGSHDDENRLRAVTLPVAGKQARPLPQLSTVRTDTKLELDGKLAEPVWKKAKPSARFVNTLSGEDALPVAQVRAAWDDDAIYLGFEVEDDYLKSEFDEHDEHLWEQDCVEMMFDPDGDGLNYFELQVSPKGIVFDTRYDSRRKPQPIGHADWNSGLENGVVTRGSVNDDEDDEGYTVEIAIPWKAFAAGKTPAQKPKPGVTWRANFYVMDTREEGQRANGWSPPEVRDFHVPARFGKLVFE